MSASPDYLDFLTRKTPIAVRRGLSRMPAISSHLFPFQKHCVEFLLGVGSGGLFLDTGLGKTLVQLEYAEHARQVENGKALILTPLAVAKQIEREAHRFGYPARVIRDQSEAREGISICNYDRLHLIDPSEFGVVTLDEASILKSFTGKTTRSLINAFEHHRWRVPATATPAPNDHMELGQYAEFCGVMQSNEMLSRFLLYAARRVAGTGVALLGINRGRLGFLADVGPAEMLARLDEILRGEYERAKRMLLRAEVLHDGRVVGGGIGLNDIVVNRHDPGRMLEIRTFIDGRYVNTQGGDGFIIATATGSTAYSLSCGGPIVSPSLDAIVLVPICPHTLSERPIIVPATAVIEIMLSEQHSLRADVICDGEITADLVPGRRLRVCAAAERVELQPRAGQQGQHELRSWVRRLWRHIGHAESLAWQRQQQRVLGRFV